MRIALLQTPSAPLNIALHGGIERVELTELEYLHKTGYGVDLYVSTLTGEKDRVHEIKDLGWRNRYLQLFYYLCFGLKTVTADILHGHYTPMLALLYPRRAVVHYHGSAVWELPLYRHTWARNRFHQAHYLFVAKWVREEYRKLYPDMPDGHCHVLYNGVDADVIKPRPNKTIGNIVHICFYAGWIPEKGIYEILEAAEKLERKGRRDFVIHYGGSAHSHYKDSKWGKASEIDAKVRAWAGRLQTVKLAGDIKRDDLPGFLENMDLGLVPSTYPDPFPLVPLEMMSAGMPVIAYDLGGPKEAIVNGKTGFLVENKRSDLLAERIEWFLDNRQAIAEMGANARKHVEENFSLEIHGRNLVGIYQQMMEQR